MITIYTDGAAQGNPGRGGYGVVMKSGNRRKELSQGFRLTTNNRMELLAVIEAFKAIKNRNMPVQVFSDSKYVIDAITKGWLISWQKKGFKGKANIDLWQLFLVVSKDLKVQYNWVKGHAGVEENERCDQLAVQAAEGGDLLIDKGYEDSK